MPFSELLVSLLATYHHIAVFIGAFFFGETVIVSAFYLAYELQWSLTPVFIAALVGTLLADSLWFVLAQTVSTWAQRWVDEHHKQHLLSVLESLSHRRPVITLLYIKFLYGTRIVMIFYVSWLKIPYRTFLFYNTIGTMLWLLVMMFLGSLASHGTDFLPAFGRLQVLLTTIVLLLIILKLFSKWITRRLTNQ